MTLPPLVPPASYDTLPYTQIKTHHHPENPSTIILTLHRPHHHNAFTPTMMLELEHAYTLFNLDPRPKCIVFTGHGTIFCAGADLEDGFQAAKQDAPAEHRDGGGRVALAIHRCRVPTVGALNGAAVGVGISMTLPMAIRLVARDAKIGFVFARRGLVMEACSSFFLPRLIGYSRAVQAVTTGKVYAAGDRVWDGLFAEVLARSEEVLPRVLEMAGEIGERTSAVSTFLMREMMFRGLGSAEETHLLDSRLLWELFESEDNKEGVESFLQKRPPKFTGTMDNTKISTYPWWRPIDVAGRTKGDPTAKPKI